MAFPGTVKELQKLIKSGVPISKELITSLASDQRTGVQRIYAQLQEKLLAEEAEKQRLHKFFTWELQLGSPDLPVAGVDEAGRGPLAGPVTAAAVILDPEKMLPGLDDSKRKTPREREILATLIKEKSLAWSVGWASVAEIEMHNILRATFLAMKRAIEGLSVRPAGVLVDGMAIDGLKLPQKALIKGDRLSASIAAASIIAKVTRDRRMEELHELYPQYGFNKHKGYPTKAHFAALEKYGPSPVHRHSFKGVKPAGRPPS